MAGRVCFRMCTTVGPRRGGAPPPPLGAPRAPPAPGGATGGPAGPPALGNNVVGTHTGLSGANLIRLTRRQRLRAAEEEHPPERLPPGLSFRGKPDGTTGRREPHTAPGPGQLVAGGIQHYPRP